MDIINDKNSKIAIFLENVNVDKIENNILYILVGGVNDFSIKALEKDKKFIEEVINQVLDSKLLLSINYENENENTDINKNDNKIKSDEDHPLFMDALNKFDGKLIK